MAWMLVWLDTEYWFFFTIAFDLHWMTLAMLLEATTEKKYR